jgi:uncharacterized membrane protein YjjP (DUF1212 family)
MLNIQKRTKNLTHYLVLISIFFLSFLFFWLFSWDKNYQAVVAILSATSYILWGVVHHHLEKDLCFEIVVEYASIALIGLASLLTLIFTA